MSNTGIRKARAYTFAATATATIALLSAGGAVAQEATGGPVADTAIDRVVVTARKREEDLLEVPMSVAVVSGVELEKTGVVQLSEALQFVPAVSVTPTPVGDLMFIRGIGSGENQGFEMSVGTFVDGVYYGRGRSSRHAFLDADRIEVLKGPQAILFGKNTIGGALNITSRRPSATPEFSLEAYVEPEFGTFQTTAVVSGPLTDTLRGRLVARSYVTDGYMDNTFLNTNEPSREDWVVRGVLEWEPTDALMVTFKGEYGDADLQGGRAQLTRASPVLRGLIAPIDPNAEYELNYVKSGPGTRPFFDREYDQNKTYSGTLTAAFDMGAHELTSITSYAGYDLDYSFDTDFTPLNFLHQTWDQHWHAWAQELRIASTERGVFEYQAGMFLSRERLKNTRILSIDFAQTPLTFGAGTRVMNFSQETNNWSLFAEGTWNATNELAVVLGYRYTDDEKSMTKSLHWANFGSVVPNPNLTVFTALRLGAPHTYRGIDRGTNNNALALTVRYMPGDFMYYVSYTQGFKAGGFDENDSSGNLGNILFDDESVNSYEAGLKGTLLNGRLSVQTAAFLSEYDNLQVSIFDGVAALIVGNAAAATSKGVEFEGQFAATSNLSFSASATYLDSKYDSYAAGPCAFGRGTTCNLTGQTLPYAPEWSGALGATWDGEIGNGWTYALNGKLFYSSAFSTAGDLDPFVAQDAFTKVDASISLYSPGDTWSFSLVGKNLTDEVTSHFGDDVPLSNILGNNYEQYVDPPRTIALQARYQF